MFVLIEALNWFWEEMSAPKETHKAWSPSTVLFWSSKWELAKLFRIHDQDINTHGVLIAFSYWVIQWGLETWSFFNVHNIREYPLGWFQGVENSTFVFITLRPPLVTLPSRLYEEETHPLTISLGLTKLLMKRRLAHQLVLQSLTLSLCQSNRGPEPRYLPNAAYTNISTPYRGKILQDKTWKNHDGKPPIELTCTFLWQFHSQHRSWNQPDYLRTFLPFSTAYHLLK